MTTFAQALGAVASLERAPAALSSPDQTVINAWQSRTLTDGTKLNLGRSDVEQGFVLRDGGIFPISFKVSGKQVCDDNSVRTPI